MSNQTTVFKHGLITELTKNYEKVPPPGGPTVVELGIYINSFYAISEQTMDYSLSIYLRQCWNDSRLLFDHFRHGTRTRIKLEENMWNHIWTPDVFFRNEKKSSFHAVTTPNRLMFLHDTSTVWYVAKITTTLSCPMKLQKYPFDTQKCLMIFESFGYTADSIVFKWLPSPVEPERDLDLPQFILVERTLHDCSQNYTTGIYPCLSIAFTLKRSIGYFMIQLYAPSVLIVILSWISFWLNVEAAPARVSLGLLSVLTTTTMSTGARDQLPRVSYIKAIDVWMSACLVFVFISFLEYAIVSVLSRKRHVSATSSAVTRTTTTTTTTTTIACASNSNFETSTHSLGRLTKQDVQLEMVQLTTERAANREAYVLTSRTAPTVQLTRTKDGSALAKRVDQISRRIFPVTFIIFNLIYWLAYTIK